MSVFRGESLTLWISHFGFVQLISYRLVAFSNPLFDRFDRVFQTILTEDLGVTSVSDLMLIFEDEDLLQEIRTRSPTKYDAFIRTRANTNPPAPPTATAVVAPPAPPSSARDSERLLREKIEERSATQQKRRMQLTGT